MKIGDVVTKINEWERHNPWMAGFPDIRKKTCVYGIIVAVQGKKRRTMKTEAFKEWQEKWFDEPDKIVDVLWSTGGMSKNIPTDTLRLVCSNEDN